MTIIFCIIEIFQYYLIFACEKVKKYENIYLPVFANDSFDPANYSPSYSIRFTSFITTSALYYCGILYKYLIQLKCLISFCRSCLQYFYYSLYSLCFLYSYYS